MESGTDPLDADSDGDGIADGRDIEFIESAVLGLPDSSFRGTRLLILVILGQVERDVARGDHEEAIEHLELLRRHIDGCGSKPAFDDWIVNCPDQIKIRTLVDVLIANLSG